MFAQKKVVKPLVQHRRSGLVEFAGAAGLFGIFTVILTYPLAFHLCTELRAASVFLHRPFYELAKQPAGALVELLYSRRSNVQRTSYRLGSTVHWMPPVNA